MNIAEKRGLVCRHGIDDLAMQAIVRMSPQLADQDIDRGQIFRLCQRVQSRLDQIFLARFQDDGCLVADKMTNIIKIGGCHDADTRWGRSS